MDWDQNLINELETNATGEYIHEMRNKIMIYIFTSELIKYRNKKKKVDIKKLEEDKKKYEIELRQMLAEIKKRKFRDINYY